MIIQNIKRRVANYIFKIKRKHFLKKNFDLDLNGVTILSNNCLGGFLYQDFNCKYYSPTISVQIPVFDFIKFVNNIELYKKCDVFEAPPFQHEFSEIGGGVINFPCGLLGGDIRLLFQHEKQFYIAKGKWNRRMQRIDCNRIVVILFVCENQFTDELLEEFSSIKYHKVIVTTNKNSIKFKNCFYVDVPENKYWWHYKRGVIKYFEDFNWKNFFVESNLTSIHQKIKN